MKCYHTNATNLLKIIQAALLFVIAPAFIHAQQAWTRPKNSYYVQAGASLLRANSLLNGTAENIVLNRDVTDITLQAYGEYGLTDHLTVTAQVPLKLLSVQNTVGQPLLKDGSLTALSNIQAALTGNFYRKNGWVASAKAGVSLPTATFQSSTGLRSGFDALSIAPSLLGGVGKSKFFSSAEIGYVFRTNGYSNRLFGAWQIGTSLGKKKRLIPIVGFELMQSDNKGTFNDGTATTTGLYLDEQSYLSPNLKIGFKATEKVMLWFSAGGAIVASAVAASPGLSFSVSYQH
jgi:hypothetical protein